MNVLVTGAFGNIGSHTVESLLKQGHAVRCFDVKTPVNRKTAAKFRRRVEVLWGDIRSPVDVAAAVKGQDVVVHLAFIIPPASELRPEWTRAINVGGTANLLQAMAAAPRPPRLVFASSVSVFGKKQDCLPPRRVSEPMCPTDHYTHHKVECEGLVRASGLQWTILRFAAAPLIRLDGLDPIMYEIPLDTRIEFVHPRDVGLAAATAAGSDEVWGKVLLIGGGPRCQLYQREFLQQALDGLGIGMLPDSAFGSTPFYTDWMDTTESQRLLHYQNHSYEDYVAETVRSVRLLRPLIVALRPLIRRWLLSKSPYYEDVRVKPGLGWHGKVALVTGASGGIGSSIARKLSLEGLKVLLVARREDRLQQLAEQIRTAGGQADVIVADLADERQCLRVFEQARADHGPVDVLVNSAGFGWYGYGSEMPWTVARQMLQVNVSATVRLMLLFLQDMKARNAGHIVNIGSVVGALPTQGVALYSATKSFLDTFTSSIYRELRGTRVHVSVVRPGAVATDFYETASNLPAGFQMPAKRFGVRPEAVADRVWALLRRPRRVAYVPGALRFIPWVEVSFGWLLDLLGPQLLRRLRPASHPAKP